MDKIIIAAVAVVVALIAGFIVKNQQSIRY